MRLLYLSIKWLPQLKHASGLHVAVGKSMHTSKPGGWQGALKQNTCGMPFGQLLLQVVRIAACTAAAKHIIIVETAKEYNHYIMTLHTTYTNALGV